MTAEELALEAAALEAIFGSDFTVEESADQRFHWSLRLRRDRVGLLLTFLVGDGYPQTSVPHLKVTSVEGLSSKQVRALEEYLRHVAEENLGSPSIYALYTAAQDWIDTNAGRTSVAETDWASNSLADAGCSRRPTATDDRFETKAETFTQFVEHETSEHATIERALGTPVTPETFAAWKKEFDRFLVEQGIMDSNEGLELEPETRIGSRGFRLKPTGRELFTMHQEIFVDDLDAQEESEDRAQVASLDGERQLAEQVDASLFLS
ncbi:hypothetical protein F1559_003322 [Cyanidiococcus yangmingshanensis]|uniref:RWD domain-containing protein n=1 Tax=Cyanidiococcus yangmingshanensis TaxID=2690220 RepID=A0A7J7IFA8_9RHOD|nr:hypothetical protein F1559_003322 [Cyanidiococcus yangmingshanensis]